jgi:putative endonuclease
LVRAPACHAGGCGFKPRRSRQIYKACLSRQAFAYPPMAYYVYILQSEEDGSYYIGHTNNLKERLERHNHMRSSYTKAKKPWKLIYQKEFSSRSEASKREHEIKEKKNRAHIEQLVRASRV